ncbi:Ethanolamine kinase 1 [Chamberlinius hualienensis]
MLILDISLVETDLENGVHKLLKSVRPEWTKDDIQIKDFTDGITNRLIGCYIPEKAEDMVLIRIYGRNTDLIIDRKAEVETMMSLSKIGCAAPLYATFSNGICYGYVPGETLDVVSVREPNVYKLIAELFVKFHRLPAANGECATPLLFPVLKKYYQLIPSSFTDPAMNDRFKRYIPSKSKLGEELQLLEDHLSNLQSPVVFCHNDVLLKNVIYNKQNNKVAFIDYEYAGFNYQAFDIANHFCEFAGVPDTDFSRYPDKDFQIKWLRIYLKCWKNSNNINENELETLYVQVNKFALASNFMWGLWGLLQAANSSIDFDFLGFGILRFEEYFRRRDEFYSLKLLNLAEVNYISIQGVEINKNKVVQFVIHAPLQTVSSTFNSIF